MKLNFCLKTSSKIFSLKIFVSGMSVNTVGWTRTKLGMSLGIVVFSILLALPATLHAGIFQDPSSQQTFKQVDMQNMKV